MNSLASLENLRDQVKQADIILNLIKYYDMCSNINDEFDKALDTPANERVKTIRSIQRSFYDMLDSLFEMEPSAQRRYIAVTKDWLKNERKNQELDFRNL
jgi:hypothetical protein